MRFSVCNELFEGWAIEDVFRTAAELGYDGVEIAPFTLGACPRNNLWTKYKFCSIIEV